MVAAMQSGHGGTESLPSPFLPPVPTAVEQMRQLKSAKPSNDLLRQLRSTLRTLEAELESIRVSLRSNRLQPQHFDEGIARFDHFSRLIKEIKNFLP